MKVYHRLEEFERLPYAVVTSGTFDGIHKGHQKILKRVCDIAAQKNGESVVITFWPHPRQVLVPNANIQILSTIEEKIEYLAQHQIDHLLILPFTKEFSQITSAQFVENILIKSIGTQTLVIGYDHKFGKNREGSFEYLKQNKGLYGIEIEEISREDIDNLTVSSTIIRESLLNGDVANAQNYLGRPYSIQGKVVKGDQIGRTIGYPTANIQVEDKQKLIPGNGIYAVKVILNNTEHKGMMSIGTRPTVNGKSRTIEVNILDFREEIYGSEIKVLFCHYIRPELKFESLELLKEAIDGDKQATINFFNNNK